MALRFALITVCIVASGSAIAKEKLHDGHLSALDKDGDGAVSREEYSTFSNFAFNTMDIDGSTSLTLAEVTPHLDAKTFKKLDTDGNGQISSGELSNQMMQDFDAADLDNDGLLN